jgi:hypothetical protein
LPNNFHFGFSINQLFHPTLNYEGLKPYYQFRNTYSFIWGVDARLNKNLLHKPSALYIYGRYFNSHDGIASFLFEYKQRFSVGIIGQFTNDVLAGMRTGYRFGSLNVNYSYVFSVLSDYFGDPGIHSIGFSYVFNQASCCPRRKGLSN